jgi:hypothetical protein
MAAKTFLKTTLALLVFVLIVGAPVAAGGQIIYVDADATGANDGSSWSDAFNYLQDALNAAWSGDEIHVAQGTYRPDEDSLHPDGTGKREATFELINGVTIKGGYAGEGTPNPNARDINKYETILTGDLNDDDGLNFANNGENSYHVVTGSGTDETAVLDGFIITGGNAYHYGLGGGMYIWHGGATASNCTFKQNAAYSEGGAIFNSGNLALTNCTFISNWAGYRGGAIENEEYSSPTLIGCTFIANHAWYRGGAIYNEYADATFVNCTFDENITESDEPEDGGGAIFNESGSSFLNLCTFNRNSSEGSGGGMYNDEDSHPYLTNCKFSGNSAGSRGGGMYNCYESSPNLKNCTFSGNAADIGGAMCNRYFSSPTMTNCTFTSNSAINGGGMHNYTYSTLALINCTFSGNSAEWCGAGMLNSSSSPTLEGCTFRGNSAGGDGGGMYNEVSSPTLTNCTFSGNSANYGGGMHGSATITNCLISGNRGGYGGGLVGCDGEITNCTIVGNSATTHVTGGSNAGGIWWCNATISNCIIWGNTGPDGMSSQLSDSSVPTYSCIQDWFGNGEGNIDADPCFADPINGDYHLLPDSPCIDAGDPNYIAEPNETDLDGRPRVLDGNIDDVPIIDMGAYEYSPPIQADIRIIPRTINLRSKGQWIAAFIWLPEEYDVADIDPNSVLLEREIKPEKFWLTEDNQVAIARFDREDIQAILEVGDIGLTITGRLTDGTVFEGTDTIKVIDKKGKK